MYIIKYLDFTPDQARSLCERNVVNMIGRIQIKGPSKPDVVGQRIAKLMQ